MSSFLHNTCHQATYSTKNPTSNLSVWHKHLRRKKKEKSLHVHKQHSDTEQNLRETSFRSLLDSHFCSLTTTTSISKSLFLSLSVPLEKKKKEKKGNWIFFLFLSVYLSSYQSMLIESKFSIFLWYKGRERQSVNW
jgi:hypothetical protein